MSRSIEVKGLTPDVRVTLVETASVIDGIEEYVLEWSALTPIVPTPLRLTWKHPLVDIAARWTPTNGFDRALPPDWSDAMVRSMATHGAPVQSFYSLAGRNRITAAVSDGLNVVELRAGVHEESATIHSSLALFTSAGPAIDRYVITLRIDTRDIPFSEALRDVAEWWTQQPGNAPALVPDVARRPMYSTWYGYHQKLDVDEVVRDCALARDLGCEAVIVDDGWQTNDTSRGYSFCGDWDPERIPDMRGFVDRVHATGMKFLLWYAVPFIGQESRAFERFKDKFLRFDRSGAGILDPRFPDVREYLIELYERHLRAWDIDGFKLDFVDNFSPSPSVGGGGDIASVPAAADRLLSDVLKRLRAIKPNVMIEFRQPYIGPLMRKYGNLFRASDCPNDFVNNRLRVIDLRLLSGRSAVHSDMIMWHPDEPPESAALQLIHVLFSVPQISVRLDRIPPSHAKMLRFWLGFWNEHRSTLMDGHFEPLLPASLYPMVRASHGGTAILCMYDDVVGQLPKLEARFHIVNGTRGHRIVVDHPVDSGRFIMRTRDCCGHDAGSKKVLMSKGVQAFEIPPAGVASFTRCD